MSVKDEFRICVRKLASRCGRGGLLWIFAITLAWAFLSWAPPEFFEKLERRAFDILVRFTPVPEPAGKFAIVLGGERSIQEVGQWPWKRNVHASLIDRLRACRLVMLDILFTERSSSEADSALIESVKRHGRVIGCTYGVPSDGHLRVLPVLPGLQEALLSVGAVNSERDVDSVFRQGLLGLRLGEGNLFPSLAYSALERVAPGPLSVDLRAHPPVALFPWKRLELTISERNYATFWINYPRNRVPIYEYVDVLNGSVPAEAFRDAVVIVGMAAAGTYDVVAVTGDRLISGSEFVMNGLLSLLSPFSLARSGALANVVWGVAFVLLSALCGFLPPQKGIGVMLVLLSILCGAVVLAFIFAHHWYPLFSPLAGCVAAYAVSVVIHLHYSALRQIAERRDLFFRIIRAMAVAVGQKDSTTGNHSIRVAELAGELGAWLGMSRAELEDLQFAATIHDVGKIGVSDLVLNKPGKFKDFEFDQMKEHPTYGVDIVKDVNLPAGVVEGIGEHHRHVDGGGYPRENASRPLHRFSRVIQIADVYDALTSKRQYKAAWPEVKVCDVLWEGRGSEFDGDCVEIFLSYKAPRWWKSPDGWTRLMCAAKHVRASGVIKERLAERADVDEPNGDGVTALMFAAAYNSNPRVVELLLKAGADPHAQDKHGYTAFDYARVFNPNKKNRKVASRMGAGFRFSPPPVRPSECVPVRKRRDVKEDPSQSPLMKALAQKRPLPEIRSLLQEEHAVDARDADGKTILMYAAEHAESPGVVDCLLRAGASVDSRDAKGKTPLMYAAAYNEEPLVTLALLFAGAAVGAADAGGRTVLMHAAATNSNRAVLQVLLQAGAGLDDADLEGKTPLMYAAAFNENATVTGELLQREKSVDRQDGAGFTALMHAAGRNKNPDVLDRLARGGADPNARDMSGNSVLYHAACNPHNPEAMIKALLDVGLEISNTNADKLLVDVLADKTDPDIFIRLAQAGFLMDTRNSDGETLRESVLRRNPNPDVARTILSLEDL